MEVRDKFSTIEQYDDLINTCAKIIRKKLDKISQLEKAEDNHIQLYESISNYKYISEETSGYWEKTLKILIARYSKGGEMAEIRSYIPELINAFTQTQKYKGALRYDYYIWMLSIFIVLDIGDIGHIFKTIEPSNDYLISYLVKYQIPSLEMPLYNKFYFKLPYQSTKEIISLAEQGKKDSAVIRLKKYLEKEWYVGNAEMGWYNDHKSKFNLHFGYWSFESGALVKILGLDDSGLKGVQYYPYDMVHWNENNK